MDGVWEGFLNEVVGMKVRPGTSTMLEGGGSDDDDVSSRRKPWEEKPLPAMPEEVGLSVALNLEDRRSTVSGLAYLDEDEEDEIADQPFSLDASFTASDYKSFTRNIHNHLPTSTSLQSILSLEISAFNFPTPPVHLPTPPVVSTSIAPYHRPSHYSNLSTSSTMSSLSSVSNGSSMPVTPSFAPPPEREDSFGSKALQPVVDVEDEQNLWGTSGTVSHSPGAWSTEEEGRRSQWREGEEEEDEDRTIAWGQRERSARASEDSERSGTVAWGEAL